MDSIIFATPMEKYSSVSIRAKRGYNSPMKIGLFGGSFNPIHNGHIFVAAAARERFGLDRVLLMVAKDPPHKQIAGGVNGQTRFALVQAALEGQTGLEASDLELKREGKSYTVDTLRALSDLYPGAELRLIVGADMLLDLAAWREPESICALAGVIAVGRPDYEGLAGAAGALAARYGARVELADFSGPEISSTAIRDRVRDAQPIEGMLPDEAAWLLYENGLYQPHEIRAMQEKLRDTLKYSRYLHSVGAMECAIALAERFHCPGGKARTAALLHDCAKLPADRLTALAEQYGVPVSEFDRSTPGLLHDRVGAFVAREEYGVADEQILSAIRRHTLCGKDMTTLDKVVYVADKIERTRDYPGVEELRAASRRDLDEAVLLCMDSVIRHLEGRNQAIQPDIFAARAQMIKNHNNEREDET